VTAGTGFPRYHYLGSAGLALIVGVLLAAAGESYAVRAKVRDAMVGAVVLGLVVLYATRAPAIDHHSTAELATGLTLAAMRGQIANAPPGAPVYIASYKFASIGGFASPEDFPGRAAVFVIFFPGDVLDGHTVRFVTDDPSSLAARRRGGRIATLL